VGANQSALPITSINKMAALCSAERWDDVEVMAHAMVMNSPEHVMGWKVLGKILLKSRKLEQALDAALQVIQLAPQDADAHTDFVLFYIA